ncbi:MAG: sulfotransferase [Lysobacterales bacterium]
MKVIGIGLNKTGTKTLQHLFNHLGYNHQGFSVAYFLAYQKEQMEKLMACVDSHDSFEDWPWPLIYQKIDQNFDDCKFILTTRKTPETWFKSLSKMAVRMGPMDKVEKFVYGYSMPHGKKKEHLSYYLNHNAKVREYFKDRPDKLLEICWENGDTYEKVAEFLDVPTDDLPQLKQINKSMPVYGGDNLLVAKIYQACFQLRHRKALRRIRKEYDL